MIKVKPDVRFTCLKPEIYSIFPILDELWDEEGLTCWITSANEGTHASNSLHYKSLAIDLRRWGLDDPKSFVQTLQRELGADYDVVLEDNHIHVEWDPQ